MPRSLRPPCPMTQASAVPTLERFWYDLSSSATRRPLLVHSDGYTSARDCSTTKYPLGHRSEKNEFLDGRN